MIKVLSGIGLAVALVCGFLWCFTSVPWASGGSVIGLALMSLEFMEADKEAETFPLLKGAD